MGYCSSCHGPRCRCSRFCRCHRLRRRHCSSCCRHCPRCWRCCCGLTTCSAGAAAAALPLALLMLLLRPCYLRCWRYCCGRCRLHFLQRHMLRGWVCKVALFFSFFFFCVGGSVTGCRSFSLSVFSFSVLRGTVMGLRLRHSMSMQLLTNQTKTGVYL